jgi:hypothetical protein
MSLEIFVWAVIGGVFVTLLSVGGSYYLNQSPSNKQLSRDFLIGAAFTGFLYPLIPDSFDEIKNVLTAGELHTHSGGLVSGDPGIKIGPANF